MRWEPVECKAGDMVRIRLGGLYHYGIFVSEDEVIQFGLPPTAENRAVEGEVKVIATDVDTFACGCIVETACLDRAEQKRRLSNDETVRRARARIGETGYNIIHNNCEHFVNECVFGKARCTQEEDVRKRWLNRPICDVYLAAVPEDVSDEGIFPEKRRRDINGIKSAALRNEALYAWKLLSHAARRSFGTDIRDAGIKKKLGGKWVSDKFYFSISCKNGVTAAAISNAEVTVSLDEPLPNGVTRTLLNPHVMVSVNGKHCSTVKYFWAEGSSEISSTLMGGKLFE